MLIGIIISLIRETTLASMEQRLRERLDKVKHKAEEETKELKWYQQYIRSKDAADPKRRSRSREDRELKKVEETYEASLRKDIVQNETNSYAREIIIAWVLFLIFWIVSLLSSHQCSCLMHRLPEDWHCRIHAARGVVVLYLVRSKRCDSIVGPDRGFD